MSESLEAEIRQLYEDWIANPSPVVCARLADRLRVAGRNDEALEVSRRGQADWPANNSIRVVIARCLRGTGDTEGARATFEEVLKADPFNLVALKNLAEISAADGRFTDAVKLYGDYLFENPGDQEAEQEFQKAKGLAESAASVPPMAPPPIEVEPSGPVPEAPPMVEEEPSQAAPASVPAEEPAEQTQPAEVQAAPVLEAAFSEPDPVGQATSVLETAFAEPSPAVPASVPAEEPAEQTQPAEVQAAPVLETAFAEPSPAVPASVPAEEPAEQTQPAEVQAAPVLETTFAESATSDPGPADVPAVPASPAVGTSLEGAASEVAAVEASTQAPEEDKPVSFPRTGRMERILKDQGLASTPPESVTAAVGTRVATTPAAEAKHPQNLRREPRSLFDLFSPEERSELFLEPYRQEEK